MFAFLKIINAYQKSFWEESYGNRIINICFYSLFQIIVKQFGIGIGHFITKGIFIGTNVQIVT